MDIDQFTLINEILVHSAEFFVIVYGEMRYFKYGRPAFYQLLLCGLLGNALESDYDLVTYYLFDTYWYGFSLTIFVEIGYFLFFFGAIMEMIGFLREKGVDCSLRRGFGVKTMLLALLPVAMICYYISILMRCGLFYPSYAPPLLCSLVVNYAAGLIAFRGNDENGFVKPLRRCCRWFILFFVAFIVVSLDEVYPYSEFYNVALLLLIASEVGMVMSLERGSKQWT